MDGKSINSFLNRIKIFSLLALIFVFCNGNAMPGGKPIMKNVTSSKNIMELNPRFVGDGSNIVFLEYQNTTDKITQWDYKLVMCDRNGHNFNYLTETGVIDYEMMPGGLEIQYLFSEGKFANEAFDEYTFYNQVDKWELRQLDLKTNISKVVEKSNGRLLAEGYKLLGGNGLPDYYKGRYTTQSPDGKRVVFIQIEDPFVKFYEIVKGDKKLIYSSDLYRTYGHIPWIPQVVWRSEDDFITLDYRETEAGLFRIVSIDLAQNITSIIYEDENINAFPKMNLDDFATMLYFSKNGEADISELWQISLDERDAKLIFTHSSQIGTVFSSMDGTSIVFSQLDKNDFDIVRLDFGSNKIQRLTAN